MEIKIRATILTAAMASTALSGCAPQPSYRAPARPAPTVKTAPAVPAPAPPEPAKPNLPQDSNIREQDIRSKSPPPAAAKSSKEPARQASVSEARSGEATAALPPPLADDSSLVAKITPSTPPQRAASLRLTEEGRKILDAGDPGKALGRLEKTIVIDSTNPYAYFYLAKAQYRMGRYRESLNFLDIAESRLGPEPFWQAEILALRGDNYRAQGQLQRAEASYNQAIRINSGNRTAADGLTRMQGETSPALLPSK